MGRVTTTTKHALLRADAEGAGAYRNLADSMRQAVLSLVERPVRTATKPAPAPAIAPQASDAPAHKDSDVPHRPSKRAKASTESLCVIGAGGKADGMCQCPDAFL